MCMKIKIVSSNYRSKIGIGVHSLETARGGVSTAALSSRGGPGGRNSGVAPLLAGNGNNQRIEAEDKTSRRETRAKKDVKNEGRTDYVYENKDTDDNSTDTKDGISTQLHAILHRNTRILQEPSSFCHISNPGIRNDRS